MINFQSPASPLLVFGVLLAMLVWLVVMEWQRTMRFRALRIMSTVIMLFALAAIILKPTYLTSRTDGVLLLTAGYQKSSADSVVRQHPDWSVWLAPDAIDYPGARPLRSWHGLTGIRQNIKTVIGQGIPAFAMDKRDTIRYQFLPGTLPQGIISLALPGPVHPHRQYKISAHYNNTSGSHWVVLRSPGGPEDSVRIQRPGIHPISLAFRARHPGRFTFTLETIDSLGSVERNPVPVEVKPEWPLNILVLISYPTFEIQNLKRFLSDRHHRLVLRYEISRNIFRYEYSNHERVTIDPLSTASLAPFDLLITDPATMSSLTKSAASEIQEAVRSGLGLVTLAQEAPDKSESGKLFPFAATRVTTDTAQLVIQNRTVILPAIPLRVQPNNRLHAIASNRTGVLTGYQGFYRGRIGFQLLRSTFRLSLAGDSASYSSIWTPLVEGTARRRSMTSGLLNVTDFPIHPDQPMELEFTSQHPVLIADSLHVPVREDAVLDNVWHSRVWFDTPGWHSLDLGDGRIESCYIAPSGTWTSLTSANSMRQNELAARTEPAGPVAKNVWRPWPPISYFLLFILTAGFLWLAPKI